MSNRSTIAKSALAAAAGLMALTGIAAAPSTASAQSYYGDNYYDPCRRDSTNRGTVGALLGGALGAAIGSNAAARNARTEGALLGGAVGAVAGAAVGNNSAACRSGYAPRSSYYNGYNSGYNSGYTGAYTGGSGYYAPQPSYYDSRYRDYDYDAYAYDRRGGRYPVVQAPGADGCTLAESPIHMPDGRVETRFVRVCRDSSGRYAVVD